MKLEIAGLLGPQMQQEISKGLFENISGLAEVIESKFKQLEENSKEKNDSIIKSTGNNNVRRILMLQTELKAKDDLINNLNLL